ncbi:MAG: MFS transporter [Bacteroidetes bacterium]|jgi:POT family proton-dependent oligopeptide transporter|nr:MFS transporter [Bacteroidota bacterium]
MDFALGLMIFGWIFVLLWIPFVVFSQRKVHPKALFTLFFAELWERFSFYGMRALLILYMTKVLFESMGQADADERAYGIYGAYGALVYGAPVIGGLVADRLLGFRYAIILGGALMALGHFTLGLEGLIFHGSLPIFFASLALIIVGNGFFKPNISSFLGTFYSANDPRKDGAFTIFYMGVNIGAFLSPLTCGYLGENYGWHYGFGLAGVGMVIGLIVFWINMKDYKDKGLPPNAEDYRKPVFLGLSRGPLVALGSLASVPIFALLLNVNEVLIPLLFVIGVVVLGYIVYYAVQLIKKGDTAFEPEGAQAEAATVDATMGADTELEPTPDAEDEVVETNKAMGQRLLVVIVLFFFHMIFWALFEQAGGSLTLFADRNVSRMGIPASQFAALNPLYIILLAPVFSWIWVKLNRAGREPSTPMKFVLGLTQLGLGFGVIVLGAQFFAIEGMVPLIFLLLMYLLHTMGELCLSPVGLSMVTKLSPAKIVGFVMGAWFLSISFAHELAAFIGKLTAAPEMEGEKVDPMVTLELYSNTYMTWGVYVVLGAALLLLLLVPMLRRWMNGIH